MYSRRYGIFVAVLFTCATLAAHGWALDRGLFFDDHWHRLQLRDGGWDLASLLNATTINPDNFIQTWWQQKKLEWRYMRPFSMLLSKVVYHLTEGSVKALHAVAVVFHLAAVLMVHHLCLRLTRRRFWAVVGGLLFVVYSHSVFAVTWLAAHNTVLQTTLMLGALLCYAWASRLDLYAGREADPAVNPAPMRWGGLVPVVVLWVLALFSRENAVVLPVLAVAFDAAFGGRRWVRARLPVYALLGVVALAFVAWRLIISYVPMPDFYVRRYDGPGYILWWVAKLMHYVTSAVWLTPLTVGPTARYNPFTESPRDILLMLAILGVMGSGYYLATRNARGWWLWPLWMLLAILPVVPLMAAPHSGYMPGVGFAVAMILGPALRDRVRPVGIGRWSPGVALWFLTATTIYIPIYRALWSAFLATERHTIAYASAYEPPNQETDIFWINLPFVNVYAQPHLREAWSERGGHVNGHDLPPLHCHVLTYAPDVMGLEAGGRIEQLDDYRFRLWTDGEPYFSGTMGRFFIEAMRKDGRFKQGEIVPGRLFDVAVTRTDERGVREFEFRFHKPLASPEYRFYFTTNQCGAARLRFRGPGESPDSSLQLAAHSNTALPADWLEPLASAVGSPVQDLLSRGPLMPEEQLQIGQFQSNGVDPETARIVLRGQTEFEHYRRDRQRLINARAITACIIHSDLYLTGPPFPDPR